MNRSMKGFRKLAQRIKDYDEMMKSPKFNKNPRAFRKPGRVKL